MISRGFAFCSCSQTDWPTAQPPFPSPAMSRCSRTCCPCSLPFMSPQKKSKTLLEPPCQHIQTLLLCESGRITPCHSEMSHLQLSDSICTCSIKIRPSPLSHHCLPLIFVCVELKVHDAPSWGGCLIVLPAEFHFTASCCEMVDARQNTRRAGSQGRKELFISLIFLLCIGRFITLPFLLPERQIEAVKGGGRCTVAALLDLTFK